MRRSILAAAALTLPIGRAPSHVQRSARDRPIRRAHVWRRVECRSRRPLAGGVDPRRRGAGPLALPGGVDRCLRDCSTAGAGPRWFRPCERLLLPGLRRASGRNSDASSRRPDRRGGRLTRRRATGHTVPSSPSRRATPRADRSPTAGWGTRSSVANAWRAAYEPRRLSGSAPSPTRHRTTAMQP